MWPDTILGEISAAMVEVGDICQFNSLRQLARTLMLVRQLDSPGMRILIDASATSIYCDRCPSEVGFKWSAEALHLAF